MMFDIKLHKVAHHTLDLVYPWVTKFHHFSALNANDVVVLMVTVRFFELRHVFAKLMFGNQVA